MLTDDELFRLGLGMPRSEVILRPHDARWARAFQLVAADLAAALPGAEFEHIGSTAVPGIAAKPILDVLGICPDLDALDRGAASLGYECKGEHGIPGRRYCVLYDAAGIVGFVHLHAFPSGHAEIARHLAFRDRLRKSRGLARAYERLKLGLQRRHARERDRYTDGKAEFIGRVLSGI